MAAKHRPPKRTASDYWIGIATGAVGLAVLIMAVWVLTGRGPS